MMMLKMILLVMDIEDVEEKKKEEDYDDENVNLETIENNFLRIQEYKGDGIIIWWSHIFISGIWW